MLAAYALGTFAYEMAAEPAAISHDYAGIVRYDPTGSVIMHASLSLICLLLALARAAEPGPLPRRCGFLAVGAVALVMVLEAATRTVIVSLTLLAGFHLLTTTNRGAALRQLLLAAAGLVLVFAAYSALVNPSFLLRLVSNDEVTDYGSGRLPSIAYWLTLVGDHPLGLGFGAVRELMADGKPFLDGDNTLELAARRVCAVLRRGGAARARLGPPARRLLRPDGAARGGGGRVRAAADAHARDRGRPRRRELPAEPVQRHLSRDCARHLPGPRGERGRAGRGRAALRQGT